MTNEGQKNANSFIFSGVFLFIILVVTDQVSKHFTKNPFLNYKFAFSLPVPGKLIYLIYVFVLATIAYYIAANHKKFSQSTKVAWTFVLAGALSNIVERIILGAVRDFVYIRFWHWTGIYNLADFYIIFGIILLALPSVKEQKIIH